MRAANRGSLASRSGAAALVIAWRQAKPALLPAVIAASAMPPSVGSSSSARCAAAISPAAPSLAVSRSSADRTALLARSSAARSATGSAPASGTVIASLRNRNAGPIAMPGAAITPVSTSGRVGGAATGAAASATGSNSPMPLAIRSAIAVAARSASGPVARIVIGAPWPSASPSIATAERAEAARPSSVRISLSASCSLASLAIRPAGRA